MDYNHIVMSVLALIFLIGLVLLIPAVILLVIFQHKIEVHYCCDMITVTLCCWQEKYSVMRTVSKALKVGYKNKLEWWAGIELAKRLLLITFVVSMPGRTVGFLNTDSIALTLPFY